MSSLEFDDSVPPPAYTEQEYDNKVSLTVQASLTDSQDEWEEWDESKFAAAAAALAGTSTPSASSSSASRGYNDVKKPFPSYPPEKQGTAASVSSGVPGPSTSHAANHDHIAPSTSSASVHTPPVQVTNHAGESSSTQSYQPTIVPAGNIHYGDDEDMSVPPPAFTGVGPSLDGPPYEEVVRLSYNPHDEGQRTPRLPSPPWLSQRDDAIPRPSSAATSILSYNPSEELQPPFEQHQPLVEPSRHVHPPSHYHRPSFAPQAQPAIPRMDFNPSIAYGRVVATEPDLYRKAAPVVDASAFYNSSVSAYMSSGNAHLSRPGSQYFAPSNANIHGSRPLPDPNRFSRNSTALSTSPISPIPKYPPGQRTAFDATNYSQYSSYAPNHPGNGTSIRTQDNRWSTAGQHYPFPR